MLHDRTACGEIAYVRLESHASLDGVWTKLIGLCLGIAPLACAPSSAPPSRGTLPISAGDPSALSAAGTPVGATFSQHPLLATWLPGTPKDHDDLLAETPYIATIRGRVVWLDLTDSDALARLDSVSGPVTVMLGSLDPALLQRVEEVAQEHPVQAFVYWEHNQADFSALRVLKHVEGIDLGRERGAIRLPDLSGHTGLKRVAISARDATG